MRDPGAADGARLLTRRMRRRKQGGCLPSRPAALSWSVMRGVGLHAAELSQRSLKLAIFTRTHGPTSKEYNAVVTRHSR